MAILQNTTVSGSLVVTGDLTARQFILSSSVTFYTESFASGSTRFGDSPDDFMRVTGSLIISSSLGVSLFASGSSGSVGIGTNSPAAKLHVVGLTGGTRGGATSIPALGFTNSSSVALFTNFDTNYGTLFGTLNTGTGWIQQGRTDGTGTAYNLALQPSGGLVGIGTTAPIGTNGTEQTLHLNSGAANYATLYVTNGANSVKAIIATQSTELLGIFGMQSNHPALFVTNDIERMRIDSSGGILFRGGTTASNGVYLANDSSLFKLYAGDSAVSVKGFAFYVTNGSTQPEAMRITSAGNVGIGTTNPVTYGARNLEVNGGTGVAYIVARANSNAEIVELAIDGGVGYLSTKSNHPLRIRTNDTSRVLITSIASGGYTKISNNGNYVNVDGNYHEIYTNRNNENVVYITNVASSPYGPFISFPSAAPNNTTNYFLQCVDSSVTCFTIWSNGTTSGRSDIRLKKNIADATPKLDNLMKLRIVNYEWIESIEGGKEIGLIAQEVEEVFPNLVITEPIIKKREIEQEDGTIIEEEYEEGDSKSIKNSVLPYITIKALQELTEQVKILKAENNSLKEILTRNNIS